MKRLLLCLLLGLASEAAAENIDLSTVPARDTVQLTIYNSEDLTLVRETRQVTFAPGNNPLQFSWAGTLIDPSSVQLTFLTHADKLQVADTTFPHDKPQMLYWNVESTLAGPATIQITYFTSGITWSADYVAMADAAEQSMNFEGFVRIHNNSGEEYENAQVRLVVGTINLVEKIAELAQMSLGDVLQRQRDNEAEFDRYKKDAAKYFFGKQMGAMGSAVEEKAIIKEGLSEYFIFTIEGTETIPNGWSKRMRSLEATAVPMTIQYRYRPAEYGEQLVRMYLLTNDTPSHLGQSPLPDGIVRVFRSNGHDGLSYLTNQAIKYIPIGDKIELNLGVDPQVVFELVKLRSWRDELWLQVHGTQRYRKIGGEEIIEMENASLAGWDEHELYTQRIRNYSDKEIDVQVRRAHPGHVVFRSSLDARLFDYQTVEFAARVAPGQRADLLFEVVRKQGTNAKQQNVTIEQAVLELP